MAAEGAGVGTARRILKQSDLIIIAGVVGIVLMLVIPLPEIILDALIALLVAEVQAHSACNSAADCVAVDTPLCTVPELGCYQAAVSQGATWGVIPTLVQMVTDQGCAIADCDCDDEGVDCVDNACVSVP